MRLVTAAEMQEAEKRAGVPVPQLMEKAMIYYWWLYTVLVPIVALDMLLRASPFYFGAWPLGLEYLAKDY